MQSSIKYRYQNKNLTSAAVKHVFKYLSILTDIKFIEDTNSPDLFYADNANPPNCARLIITKTDDSMRTQINDPSSGNWFAALDYDPVNELFTKLSLRGKSGPYAHKPVTPSGPMERTVSGIVSDLTRALCRAGLIDNPAIPLWPAPSRFAMAITHDIDIPRRSVAGGVKLLINHDLPGGLPALFDSLKSAAGLSVNPYDAIGKWIELEKELDIKSTYFIFDGCRRHPLDPKYKPQLINLETLRQNDFEIALHTGIESFSGNDLPGAKSRLEQVAQIKICGLRPHYLSASYPEYWQSASDAEFAYASSLGFDQNIGFWDGIDLPFYPFDQSNNSVIGLLEIPIAIMDCGLIGDESADSGQAFERAMRLIDQAAATGGLIVLDWHQRTFYNRDYPGRVELFTKIVRYGYGKGARFFRLNELTDFFGQRFRAL
jgi:peptidoglycan/xylan/chitin deacetylase (PgdA/CDA1 family)